MRMMKRGCGTRRGGGNTLTSKISLRKGNARCDYLHIALDTGSEEWSGLVGRNTGL